MSAMPQDKQQTEQNQCRARTNAFDRLMKSARAPGAFDLAVDYYCTVGVVDDETSSDQPPPATCSLRHWLEGNPHCDNEAYDPVFCKAMEQVERAAFQDFQDNYIGKTLYPLHRLREKMTSSRNMLTDEANSTQASTTRPAKATMGGANVDSTTGSDTAKAASLPCPKQPAKDARVIKLTAHFGSPPLERADTDDEESVAFYDSDCCAMEDSDDYFRLAEDDYSYKMRVAERKGQPHIPIIGFVLSYSDGVEVEVGNLRGSQCTATIKLDEREDIRRMVQRTANQYWYDSDICKAYAVSVGVETSYDRCFFFEHGLLTADFGGGRFSGCSGGREQHQIPVQEQPVEQQPTALGGMTGYRKRRQRFRGLEWSVKHCRIKSIVKQEEEGTPSTDVYDYHRCAETTTAPLQIETLTSLAHKAIPTPKMAFEKFFSQEKQAASELLEEYTALLKCIQCAAQTALLNWLLNRRSRALQHLDACDKELVETQRLEMKRTFPVALNAPPASFIEEGTKRCAACGMKKALAGYSRTQWIRGRLQRRCCDCVQARRRFVDVSDIPEGKIMLEQERAKMKQEQTEFRAWTSKKRRMWDLQGRHWEDRGQFHAERKRILAINSKEEQAALSDMVHKVMRGVNYHVQRLSPSFESRLLSVEDELANEYTNICASVEERQSMLAIHLHGGTKEVCKQAGCFSIFDPARVQNRKKCSVPQCFATPSSTNCGCSVEDCKYCLEPFCPGHMKSHADACSSSFPFRCGFKKGTTRLRHEQCGALLSESTFSRKCCASCGVQCCDQCVVKCVGCEETNTEQDTTYCIPLMGLPKRRPPPPAVTCEAVWCHFCRGETGGQRLDDNRCRECEEKYDQRYDQVSLNWTEYTGYSEPSEDDSDYASNGSISSEEDPLVDTDEE